GEHGQEGPLVALGQGAAPFALVWVVVLAHVQAVPPLAGGETPSWTASGGDGRTMPPLPGHGVPRAADRPARRRRGGGQAGRPHLHPRTGAAGPGRAGPGPGPWAARGRARPGAAPAAVPAAAALLGRPPHRPPGPARQPPADRPAGRRA